MTERADRAPVQGAHRPVLLVHVRPTTCGYRALVWALSEAERRDAELLAVTFWVGDPTEPDGGRSEMHEALTATVRQAVDETGVHGRTRVEVVTGPVSLAEVAAATGAELVVLASEEVAS
jgi:Universal stress protein family